MSWEFSADTPEFRCARAVKEAREKYKTELCRNWQQGFCEFADRCAFAHGEQELRTRPSDQVCRQFAHYGYCLEGTRCQFRHQTKL